MNSLKVIYTSDFLDFTLIWLYSNFRIVLKILDFFLLYQKNDTEIIMGKFLDVPVFDNVVASV